MSVIWSGITESGAIVPVQVDDTGRVVADIPEPDALWVQNSNALVPADSSNDIKTSGRLVLSGTNGGTSTLEAPASAGGQHFVFPLVGGTLAIEKDTPAPVSKQAAAHCTVESGQVFNNLNVSEITTSGGIYTIVFQNPLNNDRPTVVGSSVNEYRLGVTSISSTQISVATYQWNSYNPAAYSSFSLVVFDSDASGYQSMQVVDLNPPEETEKEASSDEE